ncbi:nitrite reductase family protein [Alcanivorax hongdengensis A-11-3]|uniref:Nitrite reductase family protein n=1 Tax=Alcanivorax hongdengensis A-11-3 TaxID=1177179 RepID=L0WH66_9GAMM|nr:FAD-dependent oxidoreductase [Alcanivorax hongdengensis]EKF75185.1 nitrite reductase family protein [Alcanivorax hongdengensis A-11-3]
MTGTGSRQGNSRPGDSKKLVVVGNGMAACRLLEELLRLAPDLYQITVVGEEPFAGYNRVMLSPLLGGHTDEPGITTHSHRWYREQGIRLITGSPVTAIDRHRRRVITAAGHVLPYDRLLLATGSAPRALPVDGAGLQGVVSFRDLYDVRRLLALPPSRIVVVGGGFLGLEAAEALLGHGHSVTLVHSRGHLLNQQLDAAAGTRLQQDLEGRGLRFVMQARTAGLRDNGRGQVTAVCLDDGRELAADLVVQAVGIVPRTALASQAGLTVGQGIRVDDTLQTFDPAIYAVGECIEHRQRTFGLVAPLYEQAAVCASHLAELGHRRYLHTDTPTRLKIAGIDVYSCGRFDGEGDILTLQLPGGYRRLRLCDNRLMGMVLYGDVSDALFYETLWRQGRDLSEWRQCLLLGEAFCQPAEHSEKDQEELAA